MKSNLHRLIGFDSLTHTLADKIMISFRLLHIFIAILIFFFIFATSYAHNWMAPEDEAKKINPVPITLKSIQKGKELYEDNCSFCHGENAIGRKREETGLSKDTPNLVKRIKNHSDGDFHWKIKNGKGDMPSFKDELSDNEIWHVINFMKRINN